MSKVKTTITKHKSFVLEEDEVEVVLQRYAATVLGCEPDQVQMTVDAERGIIRSVTMEYESTLEEP